MPAGRKFSIIIPSWNNLPFLKMCIASLRRNSKYSHQIIVHANESSDGTAGWLAKENIPFTASRENIGICRAFNQALPLAKNNMVMYMNDDMYALPQWDEALAAAIPESPAWMLSSTMIEPRESRNGCVVVADYGSTLESFRENDLLKDFPGMTKPDWSGASWPPVMTPRQLLMDVGGFSEEFSPGMYSDPDLAMKLWQRGVRYFRGAGKSLVYHFQSKSTNRIPLNNGRLTFMKKWGITPSFFYKEYLRMGQPWTGTLAEASDSLAWVNRLSVRLRTALR